MHKPHCSVSDSSTRVSVEENGKKATFTNKKREAYIKTQIDGCLIINQTSCDWWISRGNESILIELKGKDVSHALDQIEATFRFLSRENLLTAKRAGLIVCTKPSQHPAFTAKVQRAKNRLAKLFGAPLHIVRGNHEFEMEKVLSHSGPF